MHCGHDSPGTCVRVEIYMHVCVCVEREREGEMRWIGIASIASTCGHDSAGTFVCLEICIYIYWWIVIVSTAPAL